MKVQLIDYTGFGSPDPARHAANMLVFTKQTRLEMRPDLFKEIENWPQSKIEEELKYIAGTIPSSWEFVSYTFLIMDVTRAFTHQLVRTRTASYAQQALRVVDVRGWGYETGSTIKGEAERVYKDAMKQIDVAYRQMIDMGVAIEDARGVLPTNIHTNIVAKFNLRALTDTARKRASARTQGEYRAVLREMIKAVVEVHPWTTFFLERTFDRAAAELEKEISAYVTDDKERTRLFKLIDQMRATT